MKKIALCFAVAVALAGAADFKAGVDAYDRGDYATALKEWQPYAEKGDPNAEYNLGLLYARGQGVTQDYAQAAQWYQKAAQQGVAAAQFNLGVMYANGEGVTANPQEAAKWFQMAAEQGVSDAESNLGDLYQGGGAFQNYSEAEKWYRKAAEEGVASAAFSLGVMYDIGQGVPKDYDEAMKWYRKAADAGYAPALTNLGILYYNAQGIKRDLVQAYAWFDRAQKLGDPRAGELLRTTAARMSPKDVKKGQTLAAQWQPPPKPNQTETARLFVQPQTSPAGGSNPTPAPATAATTASAIPAAAPPPQQPSTPPAAPVAAATPVADTASADRSAMPKQQDVWTGVDRIVAVGDIHGDYEQFVQVLQSAGLIDGNANWTGGKAHLVQSGDVVDRGPDSRAIMNLLMKLEKQAEAAGGAVHCLIGNHEAMDVYGDLRYVSPAEYAAFRTDASEATRQYSYDQLRQAVATPEGKPDIDQAALESQRPAGFVEHRAAFSATGQYGSWIRSHNAVIKIDRTLFVHAGLGPKYADWSLDEINRKVRDELDDFSKLHGGIVTDDQGPFWYTGLAKGNETELEPLVDSLLKHFDVDRIVIGHTYADAAITPRFHGKVILIDIGLSRIYDNIGKLGCLEIDRGHAYALHRGQGLELPKDENGPDMLRYLKQAAALDPQPSPLAARIQKLEKSRSTAAQE